MRWMNSMAVLLAAALAAQAQAPVVVESPPLVTPAPAAAPCEVPVRKVCVPTTGAKTVTRTYYSVKCVDICLPFCDALGLCQKDCAAGECGKVREVRRLMKRMVKEDVADVKCEPGVLPADYAPHGHHFRKPH
jgi:hypothetical protein